MKIYHSNRFGKRIGIIFFVFVISLVPLTPAMASDTVLSIAPRDVVDIGYNVCSISYNADSDFGDLFYPVRFVLPENHNTISITLHAQNALGGVPGGMVRSVTDALTGFPDYFPGNTDLDAWMDVLSSGIELFTVMLDTEAVEAIDSGKDVVIKEIRADINAYPSDFWSNLASAYSGWQPASYYCRFIDQSGNIIIKSPMPIGSTTFALSSNVQYIEVYSVVNSGDLGYVEYKYPGYVAYDNTYNIPQPNETVTSLQSSNKISYNGHTYQIVSPAEGKTWAAQDSAKEAGGYLAQINSHEEQAFITELLNSYAEKNVYWLGGWFNEREDTWMWQRVSGENAFGNGIGDPITLDGYWKQRERDRDYAVSQQQGFIGILGKSYENKDTSVTGEVGQWISENYNGNLQGNEFFQSYNFGYICEWDYVVDDSTLWTN